MQSHRKAVIWLCALAGAAPVAAQQRAVNLTGRPVATLEEGLSLIVGLQEVAPGKVVISDPQEQRLLFGDFASGSLRDVATRGGGPGEWQIAMGVSPGPGNTAYVADPSLRKMHVIDATGKIVRTAPFPEAESNNSGRITVSIPRGTDRQGRVYLTGSPFTVGEGEQPDSIPILRWDPATRRTDTLGMLKNETRVTQTGGAGNTRVMARVGGGPFAPATIWAPLPDGRVALVHPNPYRVDILAGRGRVTAGTPVPYTPIRIGKAERDAFRAAQASAPRMTMRVGPGGATSMSTGGNSGGELPAIPDSDFPETMPAFTSMGMSNGVAVSPSGEVWVLRSRPASDKVPTYDIWSNGRLVGKATLKPNSLVVGFGEGAVYVARQDPEDDLRYVEKYAM